MPIDHSSFEVVKVQKGKKNPDSKRAASSETPGLYWFEETDPEKMAQAAFSHWRGVKTRQPDLRSEYLLFSRFIGDRDNLQQAGGRAEDTLSRHGAEYLPDNVTLEVIETRESNVTVNRPRPAFLTSGGNWKQQQKARACNKYCAGAFYENNVDELARLVRRDDEKVGIGTAKVYVEDGRVKVERVLPYENLVDEIEAKYRKPQNRAHVKSISKHRLLKDYASPLTGSTRKAMEDLILSASIDETLTPMTGYGASQSNLVTTLECWHLPYRKDGDDGVWALFLTSGAIFVKPWKRTTFPFADHITDPPHAGFRGKGMVEQLMPDQIALNEIIIDEKDMREMGVPKWLIPVGARVREEDFDDEILAGIEFDGPVPPSIAQGAAVPESFVRRQEEIRQAMYRKGRVSMEAVQNQKPAGLDSAPAQRTFEDITAKRMAKDFQAYERFHMDLAKVLIDTAREVAMEERESGEGEKRNRHSVRVPGAGGYDEVSWEDVDLDEEDYVIQASPISALPNNWSGRLQAIVERIQMGWMTPEEGMLAMEMPDTEASTNIKAAGLRNALWRVNRIIEDGDYAAPEPYHNLELHHQTALAVYNWAQTANYPEERLDLLRQYIDAVTALLKPSGPAAGGAPMPGPGEAPMPAGPPVGPQALGLPPAPALPIAAYGSPMSDAIEAALQAAESQLETGPTEESAPQSPPTPQPPVPAVTEPTAPAAQPKPQEPAKPEGETAPPPERPQDLPSAKLKAAMDRDAKSRQREEAIKAREEQVARWELAQKRWMEQGDPDGFFEAAGTTFDAVARKKLGAKDEPKPQETKAPAENPELTQAMERIKALEERNAKNEEYVQRVNLKSHLVSLGDEFELVNARGAHDAVYDTLRDTQWPEGTTLEEAIKLAAKQEEERLEKEQLKPLLTTKKARSMLESLSKTAVPAGPQAKSGESVPKTTTNSQAGDVPPNGATGRVTLEGELKRAEAFLG